MSERRTSFGNVAFISIVASVVAILVIFLVLPALVIGLEEPLTVLDITAGTNLITWLGQIMIFFIFAVVTTALINRLNRRKLLIAFFASYVISVILLSQFSFWYIAFTKPSLLSGLNQFQKRINFFRYPAVLMILTGDPEFVWLFFLVLFVVFFLGKLYISIYRRI